MTDEDVRVAILAAEGPFTASAFGSPQEWREVDGVLGLHPVEPREPMGDPPSWGARNFPCIAEPLIQDDP